MNPWDTTPEGLERLRDALREHARNLVEPDFSQSLDKLKGTGTMGFARVRAGDHVIGSGRSPKTDDQIDNKHGDVTDVWDNFGEDIVEVTWCDGSKDLVRQENVSRTELCGRNGRECS